MKRPEARFKLMFAHMGNGLLVSNTLQEVGGDYKKIAHIDADRNITWYAKRLPASIRARIESEAVNADPAISVTQEDKVFRTRPMPVEVLS